MVDQTRLPAVLRPSELPAAERGGGARTVPLATAARGAASFLNGITIFGPSASIPLHYHNCEESVVVLEGSAIFEIDGVGHELGPFDTTWIPPEVPHRFKNASATQGLKILWIYGSIDANRTLVETGESRSVASEHTGKAGTHAG